MNRNDGDGQSQRSAPPARPARESEPGKADEHADEESHRQGEEKTDQKPPKDGKQNDGDPKAEKKPFWKRPILLSVIIGVAVLLVIGAIIWWLAERNYESTDDAFIDGHIVHVAPRVAGRVASLSVNDNQYVEADTVVINIDKAPFEAAYASAKAAVLQAQTKVSQAQADLAVAQANVEQARADVTVAQANSIDAEADYKRYSNVPAGARTQQQLDSALARQRSTAAQVTEAEKKAKSMEAQVESSTTAIAAAKAQVEASEAQLQQSALDLQYTSVTAGQAGYVTRRTVEQGNYVQTGQELMTIVPKNIWVTGNFKETQLTYMKPGQPVMVKIDAYPQRKYRGHVDSIQAGTGAVFSVLPPENATGNYIKIVQRVPVKIVFDPNDTPDHPLAPGESVEPVVDISSGR